MSDTVIKVENLSKKYTIGHQQQESYTTLRDVITNKAKALIRPFHNRKSRISNFQEDFWALKDLSFDIKQGDRVGIIGRNGAGKSTLLKVLSRITEPTTGRISIKGRVASLLEVGTGFHPELTGRENIYLNGAILGMSKVEIKRKFDEIVDFAEIAKFLDTPVKRYSSGMYVRLAFAVAAHLEPEILVVDEVLAVGDAQFQKKCLGKMEEVGKEGRTVIFVSHNMGAIKALCNSGIVLNYGQVLHSGFITEALNIYNNHRSESISQLYVSNIESNTPFIKRIEIFQEGNDSANFQMHLPIKIACEFDNKTINDIAVSIVIRNSEGDWLIHSSDEFSDSSYRSYERKCIIPANLLTEGDYYVMLALMKRNQAIYQRLEDVIKFRVEFSGQMSDRTTANAWKGILAPGVLQWN
ncbi:polysaccharide/polyol phosphate ABC transporter ATP-binding protein [Nostoc sp. T09]|uniref:ABC transporter ATP-binding protein n=1 Tax=Nostoc sp. T09 TaxID=1932621 RepID=UPI000A3B5BA6|nr:ABC transporter ATP-binding protein [Nostoc sp. T09]OUL29877.1 polysaccharide/polyol phosphate ABC transporter ATP-binding protein [Nostoc sp. T09]